MACPRLGPKQSRVSSRAIFWGEVDIYVYVSVYKHKHTHCIWHSMCRETNDMRERLVDCCLISQPEARFKKPLEFEMKCFVDPEVILKIAKIPLMTFWNENHSRLEQFVPKWLKKSRFSPVTKSLLRSTQITPQPVYFSDDQGFDIHRLVLNTWNPQEGYETNKSNDPCELYSLTNWQETWNCTEISVDLIIVKPVQIF